MNLSDVIGIGPVDAARLAGCGVRTISDLTQVQGMEELSTRSGVPLERLKEYWLLADGELQAWRLRRKVLFGGASALVTVLVALLVAWTRAAGPENSNGPNLATPAVLVNKEQVQRRVAEEFERRAEGTFEIEFRIDAMGTVQEVVDCTPVDTEICKFAEKNKGVFWYRPALDSVGQFTEDTARVTLVFRGN